MLYIVDLVNMNLSENKMLHTLAKGLTGYFNGNLYSNYVKFTSLKNKEQ